MSERGGLNLIVSVSFSNEEEARIALDSLKVDPEPKRSRCTRTLSQEDNVLIANFSAAEARHLRKPFDMELDVPASSPSPSPSRANYGFTLYLASKTAFYVFLTWSLMPSSFFPYLYLPQFYWAVSIPVFCLVTLALVGLVMYPALNLCLTPAPEERCILIDSFTLNEPPLEDREVPAMFDIPMTSVSRILYLD